jgi:uncharacterized membrane protein YkoI
MMIQKATRAAAAALAVGVGSACSTVSSYVSEIDDGEAALLQSGFRLTHAIAIAEKETGGRAVEAGLDDDTGPVLISIVVAHPDRVQRVLIDPQTGKVVETATGKDDDDGDGEGCEPEDR